MNLAAQFESYLTTEHRLLPVTVKNYVVDVVKFIRWFEEKWHTPFTPQNLNSHIIALYAPHVSPRSLNRYLSSLRLFSRFLKVELPLPTSSPPAPDPWHLNDFKDYLSLEKASLHTIKNYLHDIGRCIAWLKEESKNDSRYIKIDQLLLNTYREHLCTKQHLSKSSVSRKFSSIRKYTTWASEKGYLSSNDSFYTRNYTAVPRSSPEPTPTAQAIPSYSSFPPIRLVQKVTRLADFLLEKTVVVPFASLANIILYTGTKPPLFRACLERRIVPPLHSRVLHHIRKTRPNWYRKYHSHAFVHTVHLAILVLSTSIIGYSLYETFSEKSSPTPAVLSSTALPHTFIFQGKLTDQLGNPITKEASVRLALYPNENTPASDSLFGLAQRVTPASDGTFSLPLPIPQDIITSSNALYLGLSVFGEELLPRQKIPTVSLAEDAKTVQGFPLITQKDAPSANVILALDSTGNLTIGGVASPIFQATGGSFTLLGQSILITTNPGSGGNIELTPDGTGFIDLQKPIQNTTNNNNLPATTGSVEIDDMVSIIATSSADAVLTLNQDGGGPLISALANGVSKFTVDVLGNTSLSGNLEALGNFTQRGTGFFTTGTGPVSLNGTTTIGSSSAQTVTINARIAKDSHLTPQTSEGTNNLGEASLPWDTLFTNEIQVAQCIKSASGSALLGTCLSDIRLKKDISPMTGLLRSVSRLIPVRYTWKDGGAQQVGLIAQQVEEVLPELVTTIAGGYKAIRFEILPFYMLQAIRELDNAVQQLADVVKTQMLEATLVTAQAIEATEKVTTALVQTKNLLATEKVVSPIAEISTLHTNIISPLSSDTVRIHLGGVPPHFAKASRGESATSEVLRSDSSDGGKLIIENASGSAVATIDSTGNASFSGTLSSEQLTVNSDATLSGTLRASKIFADEIQGATVSAQYITGELATFPDGFISQGPASIADLAVANQLSIGAPAGGIILADNTINVLGSTLEIQPLKQGAVSFMSGLMTIDTNGNLQVEGNATFAKDVTVRGSLAANILSPIPNHDLIIHLGEVSNSNTSQVAPPQAEDSWDGGSLIIENATGSAVFAINQQGDLTASGSGAFKNLFTKTFSVIRGTQADTSLTETVASSSAGTAIITVGEKERTIVTPFVLPISLIYITATSDTQGQTPYIARQTENSFTVQIPQRVSRDIRFNWWIIN